MSVTRPETIKFWESRKQSLSQQVRKASMREFEIKEQIARLQSELEQTRLSLAAMQGVLETGDTLVSGCMDEIFADPADEDKVE